MPWINTKSDEDAGQLSEAMWAPVWTEHGDGSVTAKVTGPEEVDGQFWADAIREVRDKPSARLAIALNNLPLPAAFREVSLALRAIIRQLRKDGHPFDNELRQLHYWAAISSWGEAYSTALQGPGYSVLANTPYAKLAELDLSYEIIGSEKLEGLNKSDRRMMREAWGEPKVHTTAHALYETLWREQERKAVERRRKEDELFRKSFGF